MTTGFLEHLSVLTGENSSDAVISDVQRAGDTNRSHETHGPTSEGWVECRPAARARRVRSDPLAAAAACREWKKWAEAREAARRANRYSSM